jgi:exodeoxyribonuclease V alpha subunit
LDVIFDNRAVTYDFSELDEIVLAYAISVHKSQGSEYPAVVIPVVSQHYILLQRNLIYTAVTRGKNMVVMVGARKALAIAVKNDKTQKRYTALAGRL